MSQYDALLGTLSQDKTAKTDPDLELCSGINVVSPLTITRNAVTGKADLDASGVVAAAVAEAGGVRVSELVLASGPCISSPVNGGVFIAIDDSGGGTYTYSGDALFEAGADGLDAHYTGSADLTALARLTVTVVSEVHADFTVALAIDNGDVLGVATSSHQQSQLVPIALNKLHTLTCERRVEVNNSTRSHVKGAVCVPAGTYDSGLTIVSATLTLVF